MSTRRPRERALPPWTDVYPDDDVTNPGRFFGTRGSSVRSRRKALQLCRQVERAAALTLLQDDLGDALAGACVAAVVPAPDAARLRVTVVLATGRSLEHVGEAAAVLRARAAVFRAEAARSIHRKRAPEIVFDVKLTAGEERERDE